MDPFPLSTPDGTLLLTAPTSADVDRITQLCQEPEIQRWTTVPSPYRRVDAEAFTGQVVPAGWRKDSPTWAVRTVGPDGTATLVGMVGLEDVKHGKGELGYWLAAEASGQGIMHRAVGLVLDAGFGQLGLEVVQWRADVPNWASWRVAWHHGFRKEGTVRALNPSRGQWKDGWIGTLLRTDPRTPFAPWDGPGRASDSEGAAGYTAGATATEPTATEPTATEPTATEPTATEPTATEPTATEPASSPAVGSPADGAPSARDPEALVRQFHQTYHLPVVADAPSVDRDRVHMRMALVAEELAELVEAVYGEAAGAEMAAAFTRAVAADDGTRDTVEAADALGDLTYVIYGMALECGIPLEDVLAEIQASNLSKLGADGRPIYREDGKVLKGPGFFPPDVVGVLARHGYRSPSRH
ncbi:bifunctional GNAT family N-acetyltransferase/nucleoside triphosphate pyrophosphohydrolase family protein [Georgenia sp. SYP-B2076]|uniref:bifunctional GNAT family N-acetyltransferase/nucleoside triphosphate pyrophosphohydrolase family protein n=1 Tax=Georgenia sp. SYP-B2076 TaxID=2495881 RepID=UPI000F8C8009|nr:bifunctional GNAT family N-acetyltransferase/nucleoside triphosphate pyrophosphohydrolase family protein [Georgenia sp. SYP-B2076]